MCSFKHASNVTMNPIGCSDHRCKQVADSAYVPYSVYGQPVACVALTYRPSDYLMEDNILYMTLLIGYQEPAADENSALAHVYKY